MRKQKQFTEEQKLQLLASPFIERVLSNHLEYSVEFKQMAVRRVGKALSILDLIR